MTANSELLLAGAAMARPLAAALPVHLHIPTPGDHYSPATGSAIMTVIYQMAQCHHAAGGQTEIMVSRGTRHDYPVGRCVEVDATQPVRGWRKAVDLLCARVGLRRLHGEATYTPASRAIPRGFAGVIFVHNNPAPMRMLRHKHPGATLCLWLNNELFRTYSRREVQQVEAAVDLFICCSHYIAGTIAHRLGRPSPKARVVHNGVDTRRFQPSPKPRDLGSCLVLFVGRIQPIKGADLLLRAGRLLMEEGLDFRIRIVGSSGFNAGDALTDYELLLRELARPLGNRVTFQPFADRHEVVREYQQATIFCAPSNWDEPFGMIIAEAMACELPVVTSRRGGIPEFAGDNVLYFTPPDVAELAARLGLLIRDSVARDALGARAHAAARHFDWSCSYQALAGALRN